MTQYLLSLLVFIPLIASVLILFIPENKTLLFKTITLFVNLLQLALAGLMYIQADATQTGVHDESTFQFVERSNWITLNMGSAGKLSIDYFVGVDGLSIPLVLLSAIVLVIGAISSWSVEKKAKGYFALYLLLSSTIVGCFVALDMFLFYLFFEFMLLPMYFLIGIWGGERREYAAIKFFIYTLVGSVFILIVMIGLYISVIDPSATAMESGLSGNNAITQVQQRVAAGTVESSKLVHTFDMLAMMNVKNYIPGSFLHPASTTSIFGIPARLLAFLLVFIGFAVKLPVVPLHTWLPDAHVEAPTPISVILAGILLKIGAYGFLRIAYSIFPEGGLHYAWLVGLLGVISIIYGACNALAAHDMKRMIAYSSVSHMGFVLIGLASVTAEGVSGAVFQLFSHGVLSALLFLIVGVLYDRTHDKQIENYRGLAGKMPVYTSVVIVAFFASLGLPGFSGFIGELFALTGAFGSAYLPKWMAILSMGGLILGAAYFLWTLQGMFFGTFWVSGGSAWQIQLTDLSAREKLMMVSLAVLGIVFGLFPGLLLDVMESSVAQFVKLVIETNNTANIP
ncbi:NADH-quinone oxidoreductase subunit M [Rhodocytophaga rosea]|uniref:NADH-quinone oxidoreductase subunit M n=1 Tax=Rhodocytophaga rosea TaxID=2704465 RepID=A0A6C0GQ82_9BACT|nr:NADH-quinone oxidoreductase subunit M [Rhodocytophaga rosea]QHT70014.1 NADH-quinone oxidoreductase subunit M [Rhodocytophaga rosea]